VERAQKLQALLEMRRAKLSAAEEEQHRLQEAEKEREKQRAAYEASVLRRRAAGQQLTRAQQQHVSSSRGEPLEDTATTDAPKRPIVTTKHGLPSGMAVRHEHQTVLH
jgi:septum formation inhibitor MinC